MGGRDGERIARWFARGALLVASVGFRLPVLLNASALNSDVAIVGLQGRHLGDGAWSAFLWGSGYQSSADALWAGVLFKAFGATPTVLVASALSLHIALTFAVFEVLLRAVTCGSAVPGAVPPTAGREIDPERVALPFLLALLLVFTPPSVHSYALNPPRQAAITLAGMAMLLAWSREPGGNRGRQAFGVALAGLAAAADPYALLFTPAVLALALAPLLKMPAAERLRHGIAVAGGALLGQLPGWLLRHSAGAKNGPLGFDSGLLGHNAEVLRKTAGPWGLALVAWAPKHVMDWAPWEAPAWLVPLQGLGAVTFLGLSTSGLWLARTRTIPIALRGVGAIAALTMIANVTSFLGSVMVFDHFAMRYLAVLVIVAPLAFLPAAYLLGPRRFALVVAPWLLSAAVCGAVGYLPFRFGDIDAMGQGADEHALRKALEERNLRAATADYWACYRLDFLWEETIAVVPTHVREDRHAAYRETFDHATRIAYVYDAGRSRESLVEALDAAKNLGDVRERLSLGPFTVFVIDRSH